MCNLLCYGEEYETQGKTQMKFGHDADSPEHYDWYASNGEDVAHATDITIVAVHKQSGDALSLGVETASGVDGAVISSVALRDKQGKPLSSADVPEALRLHLSAGLEEVAQRFGKTVDPEAKEALETGRELSSARENEFLRETRNLDHDLEAAYLTRKALKQQALDALDEGRDEDARAAMERLGEVKQSIRDYQNPRKPRPVAVDPLSEDEELEVQLAELMTDEEVSREAAGMAIAHFGKEAADALSCGDIAAHDAAIEKVRYYTGAQKALNAEEEAAFAQAEKDAEGTEFAVEKEEHGGHAARIRSEQEQRRERGPDR